MIHISFKKPLCRMRGTHRHTHIDTEEAGFFFFSSARVQRCMDSTDTSPLLHRGFLLSWAMFSWLGFPGALAPICRPEKLFRPRGTSFTVITLLSPQLRLPTPGSEDAADRDEARFREQIHRLRIFLRHVYHGGFTGGVSVLALAASI